MTDLTHGIAIRPTSIRSVRIEKLFGYLDYTLPINRDMPTDFGRLMILYGDNGSGKTTLLTLIFCLLSPMPSRGEKTYIARVPFRLFEIEFDNGTKVSAQRGGDQLTGSFTLIIREPTGDDERFEL